MAEKVMKCEEGCTNTARFYVSQTTIPQRLANGNMESAPAGRSALACGKHLVVIVTTLGTLPFKTNDSVSVTLV